MIVSQQNSQSKDGIRSEKWSYTFSFKIVYSQPYDPMFPISEDSFYFPFLVCNILFCFPSNFHVSNLFLCFQSILATVIFELPTGPRRHINPYWQITENSSRTFSKIFIFRVITQAIYWKTHPFEFFVRNHIWFIYRIWII